MEACVVVCDSFIRLCKSLREAAAGCDFGLYFDFDTATEILAAVWTVGRFHTGYGARVLPFCRSSKVREAWSLVSEVFFWSLRTHVCLVVYPSLFMSEDSTARSRGLRWLQRIARRLQAGGSHIKFVVGQLGKGL